MFLAKKGFKTSALDKTEINVPSNIFASYNIQFFLQDICENLSLKESFDVMIFAEVLEHLPAYHPKILKSIRNYLKSDGLLFLSTPDREGDWPLGKLQKEYGVEHFYQMRVCNDFIDDTHYYIYNLTEIKQLFLLSGFKIISLDSVPTASGRRHIYAVLSSDEKEWNPNEDPTALNI